MQLEDIKREHFNSYKSGEIIAGIKWMIRTDLGRETHECYQYNIFEDVMKAVRFLQACSGMLRVEIVTHKGGYKGMKSIYKWEAI